MPRLARLDAPGVLHHVMGRGIERKKIFLEDRDRNDFVTRLAALADDESLAVYAWALLPNHFHLLVKTGKRPLASSMRKLLTGYAVNFNKRHKRHGHLFQNRYKSIVCQEDAYLKELVRYIHLNAIRAGLARDLEGLKRYPWSGHIALVGRSGREWHDTHYVLSYFGKKGEARRNYLTFVEDGIRMGRRPELVGGGLIRSLGGWSEVLALRKREERQLADQRILGDGEFVKTILSEIDDLGKESLRAATKKVDLPSLVAKVCEVHNVSPHELHSGSRRHEVVEARRVVSHLAVKILEVSGAEIARFLGVTTSCITRAVSTGELPMISKYIDS
jgi:REP element-mobilizing transposase RayT